MLANPANRRLANRPGTPGTGVQASRAMVAHAAPRGGTSHSNNLKFAVTRLKYCEMAFSGRLPYISDIVFRADDKPHGANRMREPYFRPLAARHAFHGVVV